MKCIAVASYSTEIIFTKAYSLGSCLNMCGKAIQDCSCSSSCKLKGDCCTDYDTIGCDLIVSKAAKVNKDDCNKNANCSMCDDTLKLGDDTIKCNQCQDGFYLLDGRCYQKCPEGTNADDVNFVCLKKPPCNINNCDECYSNNPTTCKTCQRGTFMYNSSCLDKCPEGYRADRITWTCLEPPSNNYNYNI
jgi:hypothetical protein